MRDLPPPVWRATDVSIECQPLPDTPLPRCRALVIRSIFIYVLDGEASTEAVFEACRQRRLFTDLTRAGALNAIHRALKPIATSTSPRAVRAVAQAPTAPHQMAS